MTNIERGFGSRREVGLEHHMGHLGRHPGSRRIAYVDLATGDIIQPPFYRGVA
jgi:hypothetical protein